MPQVSRGSRPGSYILYRRLHLPGLKRRETRGTRPTIFNAESFGYTVAVKIVAAVVFLCLLARSGAAQDAAKQGSLASETAQSKSLSQSKSSQTDESSSEIPLFHAQSRQVIVEAEVWEKNSGKTGKEGTSSHTKGLRGYQKGDLTQLPPPARGLMATDFHAFDNGTERKINFFREEDFPTVDTTNQWMFFPTIRGIWGDSTSHAVSASMPATAAYLLGYIPPPLRPGECHAIRVVADDREVRLNRTQYCAPAASHLDNTATEKEIKLRSRMENLLSTDARESTKVHIQASVFWSSGVLTLAGETPRDLGAAAPPANEFRYVVEVHDSKAPASVHIATAFNLFPWIWNCSKGGEEIHVLGAVYDVHGRIAHQFGGAYTCQLWRDDPISHFLHSSYFAVPTRFDAQIDLRPGDYELRVVVSDGKTFGEGRLPLHVVPLEPQRVGISDVTLCDFLRDASWILRDAGSVSPFPVNPAPLVSKNVQFFPAIDGRVRPHAPISLYFEIYKSSLDSDETAIYYNVRVTDVKTGVLVMNTGPMSAAKWVIPENPVVPIGLNLDIKKLPIGSYELEVQASDAAGRHSEWRGAKFNIR